MKRLILASLVVALLGTGYSFEQAWKYLYEQATAENRVLRPLAAKVPELEEENQDQSNRLRILEAAGREAAIRVEYLSRFETSQAEYDRLRRHIDNRREILASLDTQVNLARSELGSITRDIGNIVNAMAAVEGVGPIICVPFNAFGHGTSMEPTFDINDIICMIERTKNPFTPAIGDIVIAECRVNFYADYIHRIVGGSADTFWITVGDGNEGQTDDGCHAIDSAIIWKVISIAKITGP